MTEEKKKPEPKLNCTRCGRDIRRYRHVYPYGYRLGPVCIDCAIRARRRRK